MEVDFSELNDRIDSALHDPDPRHNLAAMLGLYMATELKAIKDLVEKSHKEQTQELTRMNKEVLLLRKKLNEVEKSVASSSRARPSNGKIMSNSDNFVAKKRKLFEECANKKKSKPPTPPVRRTSKTDGGADGTNRSPSINIQMFQSLNEQSGNPANKPHPLPQTTNFMNPATQEMPTFAQRKMSAKSYNFNSVQLEKEGFISAALIQQAHKVSKSSRKTITRPLLHMQNQYECKICSRQYKIYWGGIIKHLSDKHSIPENEDIMRPYIKHL